MTVSVVPSDVDTLPTTWTIMMSEINGAGFFVLETNRDFISRGHTLLYFENTSQSTKTCVEQWCTTLSWQKTNFEQSMFGISRQWKWAVSIRAQLWWKCRLSKISKLASCAIVAPDWTLNTLLRYREDGYCAWHLHCSRVNVIRRSSDDPSLCSLSQLSKFRANNLNFSITFCTQRVRISTSQCSLQTKPTQMRNRYSYSSTVSVSNSTLFLLNVFYCQSVVVSSNVSPVYSNGRSLPSSAVKGESRWVHELYATFFKIEKSSFTTKNEHFERQLSKFQQFEKTQIFVPKADILSWYAVSERKTVITVSRQSVLHLRVDVTIAVLRPSCDMNPFYASTPRAKV